MLPVGKLRSTDYRRSRELAMIDNVKQLLFTVTGLIVTVLHVCFIVGAVTCIIGLRLYVLRDVPGAPPATTQAKK